MTDDPDNDEKGGEADEDIANALVDKIMAQFENQELSPSIAIAALGGVVANIYLRFEPPPEHRQQFRMMCENAVSSALSLADAYLDQTDGGHHRALNS